MQKKNNNYKDTIILGVILITFGITLMFINTVKTKREKAFSDMNLMILDSVNTEEVEEEETEPNNEEEPDELPEEEPEPVYEPYMAILRIPKINLERGFYDKNSSLNNLNSSILFHKKSNYPDTKNGNVILAGHSGNSSVSRFSTLYKLDLGDTANITYKNKVYNYKIVDIYTEKKDGLISIYRNKNKDVLTLITCTYQDNTTQTVYILEKI